jgi:hypothetical protein
MPDPTGAKPLGVVVRHPADWFSDESCSASWFEEDLIVGPGQMWIAIGFFNQDSNGRVMRVYGHSAFSEGGGGMGLFWVNGTIGSQVNTARNVRPDRGAPGVSVWAEHQQTPLGPLNPFSFGQQVGFFAAPGFDSGTVFSPFPFFIVPPGWSLVGTTPQSSTVAAMALWFQMANL